MLGPEGVEALTTELQELTATVEGLRILGIGLTLTIVALFALVLGLWNKVHPAEEDAVIERPNEQGNYPRLTGGVTWPKDPESGDLHLGNDAVLYKFESGGWAPVTRAELVKGTVGGS